MKKNLIFFAAIAAAALASCTKETAPVEQPQAASYSTIKAVIDQDTKATVDGVKFAFEVGDAISVFRAAEHKLVNYQCLSIDEEGLATFVASDEEKAKVSEDINELIATFPQRSDGSAKYIEDGKVEILLPQNHDGYSSLESPGYDPTSIPFIAYRADTTGVLHFKQTCGMMELTLKGTAKISKIVLESDGVIAGTCTVDYKAEKSVLTMTGETKVANYPYKTPVQLTADGVKFYFGLPTGTHNIKFTFYDDDFGSMTKTATGLKIDRGVMVPTTLTYEGTVDATDLSEGGAYANCYVIPEAGVYCFDAKKPDGTDLSASCVSADWVWATSGEWNPSDWATASVTDVTWYNKLANQVKYVDGKIYVNATMSTTGDLVVGAFDKDGAFVWSWHLWFTKDLADVTVGDYTWMDRNLGCGYKTDVTNNSGTQTNAARGLYYQGGRKDPIVGARVNGSDEGFPVIAKDKGTAFYVYNNDVLKREAGDLGWVLDKTNLLNTDLTALSAPLSMAEKTKTLPNLTPEECWTTNSNPCPAGYTIPTKEAFEALGTPMTITKANLSTDKSSRQASINGVVFPISGNRDAGDGKRKNGTTKGRYWTSTHDITEGKEKNIYYNEILVDGGSSNPASSARFNGNSVRCIKAN